MYMLYYILTIFFHILPSVIELCYTFLSIHLPFEIIEIIKIYILIVKRKIENERKKEVHINVCLK